MGSRLQAITCHLPEEILTNSDLARRFPAWQAEKVESKTGIRQRHRAAEGETASDLAFLAAEKLFETCDRNSVDFLLFCTQSPDYFLPASACILQDRLGLRRDIGALDFNQGCSGYVYGLALAKGLISGGLAKTVLLLTGDTYSKYIAADDISNLTIFSDAGTASLITYSEREQMGEFVLGSDGSGAESLIVKRGGMRFPATEQEPPTLFMDGPEIYGFTIEEIPALVENVLAKNNLTLDRLDYCILHQANKYMLEFLRQQIKLPAEKFHLDILDYGNTGSSTIPLALADCMRAGRFRTGDKVLLAGFGVGYSWAGTLLDW